MSYKENLKNIQKSEIIVKIETLMFQNATLFSYFKGLENNLNAILSNANVKSVILENVLNELPNQIKQFAEIKFLIHDNQDSIVESLKSEWEKQVKYAQSDISFAELSLIEQKLKKIVSDNKNLIEQKKQEKQLQLEKERKAKEQKLQEQQRIKDLKDTVKFLIHDNQDSIVESLKSEWEKQVKYVQSDISSSELRLVEQKLRQVLSDNKHLIEQQEREKQLQSEKEQKEKEQKLQEQQREKIQKNQAKKYFEPIIQNYFIFFIDRNSSAMINSYKIKEIPNQINILIEEIIFNKKIRCRYFHFLYKHIIEKCISSFKDYDIILEECSFDERVISVLINIIINKKNINFHFKNSTIITQQFAWFKSVGHLTGQNGENLMYYKKSSITINSLSKYDVRVMNLSNISFS